ncbi:hypothetical protein HWV62_34435 [Athelia sp. TMB]|nr:hypothetical protein HWV62_34435 [Athelia sp. TMB]
MDRKNKKAAQVAAQAAGGATSGGTGGNKGGKGGNRGGKDQGSVGGAGRGLLTGSTAPTRRMPMPNLKATISPSAPAPPVKDTDFANFGMDVEDKLATAPALPPPTSSPEAQSALEKEILRPKAIPVEEELPQPPSAAAPTATPLPLSTPAHARTRLSHDFGPIGSPPRSISSQLSPGTSPSLAQSSSLLDSGNHFNPFKSPFSAPHTQTSFSSPPRQVGSSGIAASLGATTHLGWSTDHGPVPSQVLSASMNPGSRLSSQLSGADVLEDEDLEEFVPGSLSELLSPSERSRRMSRTHSGQQQGGKPILSPRETSVLQGDSRHHYSRSVPAPSLLGDIKSIWSTEAPPLSNGSHTNGNGNGNGAGNYLGTPSSFKSNGGFGGRAESGGLYGDASPSQSAHAMLSPSNASAAFLGMHHRYLNNGAGGAGMGMQRSVSGENRLSAHSNFSGLNGTSGVSSSALGGVAMSPPRGLSGLNRPSFAATHDSHIPASSSLLSSSHLLQQQQPAHPHQSLSQQLLSAQHLSHAQPQDHLNHSPSGAQYAAYPADYHRPPSAALSPSSRALQAHAPGQSLPQGLAAGYSRIHALPPPPNLPSPSFSGIGSSPGSVGNGLDWAGVGGKIVADQPGPSQHQAGTSPGLETMFSRKSYSAAAARPSQPSNRVPSGGKPWAGGVGGPLSPLSKPVVISAEGADDDDLFSMDG